MMVFTFAASYPLIATVSGHIMIKGVQFMPTGSSINYSDTEIGISCEN